MRAGLPREVREDPWKRVIPQDVTKRQSIANTETDHLKPESGTVAGNRDACCKVLFPW